MLREQPAPSVHGARRPRPGPLLTACTLPSSLLSRTSLPQLQVSVPVFSFPAVFISSSKPLSYEKLAPTELKDLEKRQQSFKELRSEVETTKVSRGGRRGEGGRDKRMQKEGETRKENREVNIINNYSNY